MPFISRKTLEGQAGTLRDVRSQLRTTRAELGTAQEQLRTTQEELLNKGRKDKERFWAGMYYPRILGEAVLLVLNNTIRKVEDDEDETLIIPELYAATPSGPVSTEDGPGVGSEIRGKNGHMMFVVWPYDNESDEGHVRLWRPPHPPLDTPYQHLRPGTEVGAWAVSAFDMKAWAGYAKTVGKGRDPRVTIDHKSGAAVIDSDLGGMRKRMAELGHTVMLDCEVEPGLTEHVRSYMEGEIRSVNDETLRMMGAQAAVIGGQPARAIAS